MPKKIEITVYEYAELNAKAQSKARDWYRDLIENHDYAEHITEDAATVAEILGVTFKTREVKLLSGKTRAEPCIFWTGFSSQGDGACFEGSWRDTDMKDAAARIRNYAPTDKTLHSIADKLERARMSEKGEVTATATHDGHYCHAGCMSVQIELTGDNCDDVYGFSSDTEKSVTEALRDFANWIYRQLEASYYDVSSDENIAETIIANEYEFTASGKRFVVAQ